MTSMVETAMLTQLNSTLKYRLYGAKNDDPDFVVLGEPEIHNYFVDNLCANFHTIFPDMGEFDLNKITISYTDDVETRFNYELLIYDRYFYFVCERKDQLKKYLIYEIVDGSKLFSYNPIYILGFVKDESRMYHTKEVEYPEPDLETDEDIPLYDTDDCPVCMEKFGITERQELIGNHPTKKVLRRTKTICVKRNTYCGHPLCLTCFKTICNSSNVCCPCCRTNYEDSGDVYINESTHILSDEDINDMIDNEDDMLYDMVDINALVDQSICADGLGHLLGCDFVVENDEMLFGVDDSN